MARFVQRGLCVAVLASLMPNLILVTAAAEAGCSHVYETISINGTCTDPGMAYDVCTLCGDTANYISTPPLGHSFDQWTVSVEPACTQTGIQSRGCIRCDYVQEEQLQALGHAYQPETVMPTCTKRGYTQYTCGVCGDSYKAEYVEALGHDYTTSEVPPTATARGYTQYTCVVCGDRYRDNYVSPTGNQQGQTEETVSATDTTAAEKVPEETSKPDSGAAEPTGSHNHATEGTQEMTVPAAPTGPEHEEPTEGDTSLPVEETVDDWFLGGLSGAVQGGMPIRLHLQSAGMVGNNQHLVRSVAFVRT